MKNRICILAILFVMLSCVLVSLSGCKWDSNGTKKKVEAKLKEKYGITFATSAIGDRLNTDYTRLYCYPKDNRDILFEVVYYDDGRMTDDYVERKFECQLERELVTSLKDENIQAVSKIAFRASGRDANKNYTNMSLNDYIEDVKTESLFVDLAINVKNIKSEEDAEKLVSVIEKFSSNHNMVGVCVPLYFVEDRQFGDVESYFRNYTSITEASMDKYIINSDKTKRTNTIFVNRTKGSETEIYPISILEAARAF